MSDLAATNCGCGCNDDGGCNSIIWLIILLSLCGGCGTSSLSNNGGCDSCVWIILLLFFCGNNGNGCGCF